MKELAALSTEVNDDKDLANVAAVSAGGNEDIGKLIADAMARVGRQGVVTMEESKTAEDNLVFVEGMQFERGYYSPYFVTDPERMVCEYENCKVRGGRRFGCVGCGGVGCVWLGKGLGSCWQVVFGGH